MKRYKHWSAVGELSCWVEVLAFSETTDGYGERTKVWQNVFGEGQRRPCRFINDHGKDVYTAYHEELREPAKLLLRYDPLITHLCRILVEGEEEPYEIISPDNIRKKGRWLELTVQRAAKGAGGE